MADETVPPMPSRHLAVRVKNNILIFGGESLNDEPLSYHVIWMFNVYTEQWRKHVIPESKTAPHHIVDACAVAILDDVYVFGGLSLSSYTQTNALWTLKRTSETCYVWSEIPTMNNRKAPSPRGGHKGWEYAGHLWVFAGYGPSTVGYLNDNGEYASRFNNQLLSFNPSSQEWTNPKSYGAIPSPRDNYAAAIVSHNVWFYGGARVTAIFDELYELNMLDLIWTQIQTGHPKPQSRAISTLNGVSGSKLVLHGGHDAPCWALNDTWILDIPSQTWRQYRSNTDHARWDHTSTVGVNDCSVIIGGAKGDDDTYDYYSCLFFIMLEPRSLQQLAMQMIFKHRVELPWQHLPNKLRALLGITESGEHH